MKGKKETLWEAGWASGRAIRKQEDTQRKPKLEFLTPFIQCHPSHQALVFILHTVLAVLVTTTAVFIVNWKLLEYIPIQYTYTFLIDMDFWLNFGRKRLTGRIFIQSTNLSGEDQITDQSPSTIIPANTLAPLPVERFHTSLTQESVLPKKRKLVESATSERCSRWSGTQDTLLWLDTDYLEAYSMRS